MINRAFINVFISGEVIVSAIASLFMPISGEGIGVGKVPISYKMAISQKCEIVIWVMDERRSAKMAHLNLHLMK